MVGCTFLINPFILLVLFKMHWICSSELNFESKNKPKCFWKLTWWIGLSLKCNDGYGLELFFRLNSNSWACLQGSGLKFIFHCSVHSQIFERSWLTDYERLIVLAVISSTLENKEVLTAKSFGLDCTPFGKSFT